jgi:hypothetical protein
VAIGRTTQAGRPARRPAPRFASTRSHFPALSLTMSYRWAPTGSYFPFHGISLVRSLFAETDAVFLSMFIFLNCLPMTHAPTTPLPRQNHLAPHLALAQPPRARALERAVTCWQSLVMCTYAVPRPSLVMCAYAVPRPSLAAVASPAFAVVKISACRIPAAVLRTLEER